MTQPKQSNERIDRFQLDENSPLKRLGLRNKTKSSENDERNGLSSKIEKAPSNAVDGAKEKDKTKEDGENSVGSKGNGNMIGDITQKENADDKSNEDNGSKSIVSPLAGKAKTRDEGNKAAEVVKNENKVNNNNDGNNNESKASENARKSPGKVAEENMSKMEGNINENNGEKDTASAKLKGTFDAANATEEINTVKQFDKILSNFLTSSSPEKRKELLKLTWHDLRQRHAKDKGDSESWQAKLIEGESEENRNVNKSVQTNESDGTGRKQSIQTSTKSTKTDDFESIVGRIREKVTLLKELVQYTKMKKMKKAKNKLDPYAGFKREGIS